MSVYDAMAPDFERRRALPDGVAEAVRAHHPAIRAAAPAPRAGSGRRNGQDRPALRPGRRRLYRGRSILRHAANLRRTASRRTSDASRRHPPAVPAMRTSTRSCWCRCSTKYERWRDLLTDTIRVLRPGGIVVAGRVAAPDDGVDAQMKDRLAAILAEMDVHPYRGKFREDAHGLAGPHTAPSEDRRCRDLDRRPDTGRLSANAMPGVPVSRCCRKPVKQEAMHRLRVWAAERFGSLDTVCREDFRFELIIHRFQQGTTP